MSLVFSDFLVPKGLQACFNKKYKYQKQRLDELLDGEKDENKQNIADSGNSSLTAAMGEGRIKALRAKMMAHKKKNHISNLEDYNIENG